MAKKSYEETFNDGVLLIGHYKDILSEKKKRIGKEFVKEGKLFFAELSAREQDQAFAQSVNTSLDLKVKTILPPNFKRVRKADMTVKIDQQFYDVIKVDTDARYLYLYLTKAGDFDERQQGTSAEDESVSRKND